MLTLLTHLCYTVLCCIEIVTDIIWPVFPKNQGFTSFGLPISVPDMLEVQPISTDVFESMGHSIVNGMSLSKKDFSPMCLPTVG